MEKYLMYKMQDARSNYMILLFWQMWNYLLRGCSNVHTQQQQQKYIYIFLKALVINYIH